MTAVEKLVEETGKLCESSLKSFEEGLRELSYVEKTLQTLIDVVFNLQQQLSNLVISKIEPAIPINEETNEPGAPKECAHSIEHIDNYNLNLGSVNVYSLVEDFKDKFAAINPQKSGLSELYSPTFFFEKQLSIKSDIIEALSIASRTSLSKEVLNEKTTLDNDIYRQDSEERSSGSRKVVFSEIDNLYEGLIKSIPIINELNTIYYDMVNNTVERHNLVSEKNLTLNRSIDFVGEIEKAISYQSASLENQLYIKPDIVEPLATTLETSALKAVLNENVTINDDIAVQDSIKKSPAYDTVFSGTETLHANLKKSTLIINELYTIYGDTANILAKRNQLISEKNSTLDRSIDLFVEVEKNIKNKEISNIADFKKSSDKIHHFSEIIGDASKSLFEGISEAYNDTDISSLNVIFARTLHSGEVISNEPADAHVSLDTIRNLNQTLYFNEALDSISRVLHQSISKAHNIADGITDEITDVLSLNEIPGRYSQPAKFETSNKEPHLFSDQGIFEIPALKPRKQIFTHSDAAIENASRLSNAIEIRSRKETISNSSEAIAFPFIESATSSAKYAIPFHSVFEPSIYVSNAFESISDYITAVAEIDRQISEVIDRQMNGVMGQEGIDVTKILRHSHPMDQMLSGHGGVALDLHKITLENDGTTLGMQIMDSSLEVSPIETLDRARLSALNNISMLFPQEGEHHILTSSMTPITMENVFQIISGSQKEPAERCSGTKSVNFQNTFNIVVNVKNGESETELRDLGRKIGQVLSDEIRRYGGIM